MEKWEELLKNPEISDFIKTHQGAATRIMTASQKLAENTDALEALTKLLPALDQQVVNVFFSYKTEDEAAASAIVDLMEENAAENSISPIRLDLLKKSSARVGGKKFEMPWTRQIGSFCSCPILPMSSTGPSTK